MDTAENSVISCVREKSAGRTPSAQGTSGGLRARGEAAITDASRASGASRPLTAAPRASRDGRSIIGSGRRRRHRGRR